MLDTIDPFRRRSVALALYRMLTSHRFDICVVRNALEATGRDHDRQAYAALRLHHCEHYHAMPPGFHADFQEARRHVRPDPSRMKQDTDEMLGAQLVRQRVHQHVQPALAGPVSVPTA